MTVRTSATISGGSAAARLPGWEFSGHPGVGVVEDTYVADAEDARGRPQLGLPQRGEIVGADPALAGFAAGCTQHRRRVALGRREGEEGSAPERLVVRVRDRRPGAASDQFDARAPGERDEAFLVRRPRLGEDPFGGRFAHAQEEVLEVVGRLA